MTTADIHALTGAYALNAIPATERAAFERHLAECESCAQEVGELQATAGRLGDAVSEQPPPELKARVLARISEVRQLPPIGEPIGEPTDDLSTRRERKAASRSPWPVRVLGAAAAVLLVVTISLGTMLAQSRQDLDSTQAQAASMAGLLSANDARMISGSTTSGLRGTVLVSREQGKVMLLASNVPPAPEGKTHQVWLLNGGVPTPHSVGLITPDADGRASIVDDSGITDAADIAVTVEPAGGSEKPSTEPIMAMALPV
ncbi:MAG: anti-sigma factor [Actinomycetota bacterium]|nr:anti-sigma factor [Actinomycetota bacterium]